MYFDKRISQLNEQMLKLNTEKETLMAEAQSLAESLRAFNENAERKVDEEMRKVVTNEEDAQ